MPQVVLFLRILVGAVFLMSGLTKLAAPRQFASDVRQYRIVPTPLSDAFAYTLPFGEVGAAALMLSGLYPQWAAAAMTVMLLAFMGAVGVVMVRGQSLSCACFGLLYRERVGWSTQIRDGILLAMALVVFFGDDGTMTVSHLGSNLDRPLYALALAATIAAVGFALVVAFLSVRHARRQRAPAHEIVGEAQGHEHDHEPDAHAHDGHEHAAP